MENCSQMERKNRLPCRSYERAWARVWVSILEVGAVPRVGSNTLCILGNLQGIVLPGAGRMNWQFWFGTSTATSFLWVHKFIAKSGRRGQQLP